MVRGKGIGWGRRREGGKGRRGGGAHCMASFLMDVVASMKRVSVGAILWKTTLEMEDLPLL